MFLEGLVWIELFYRIERRLQKDTHTKASMSSPDFIFLQLILLLTTIYYLVLDLHISKQYLRDLENTLRLFHRVLSMSPKTPIRMDVERWNTLN